MPSDENLRVIKMCLVPKKKYVSQLKTKVIFNYACEQK